MKYGTVCSGIGAPEVAWQPLGWQQEFASEIDKNASRILAARHPNVPNHGDMTKFQEWPDHAIDLLVGGTPCQSYSVAGLRKGLDDPRGDLMLTFGAVAKRYGTRIVVWENVPGVLSSNGGRDFGTFLGMLGELGYGYAYRVLDAQYIRVDGFARAVPQRRRRVFVVGYLGNWRRAAAVLFERESLQGHLAPGRKTGKDVAPTISARTQGGGGLGTDFDCDGGLVTSHNPAATLQTTCDELRTMDVAGALAAEPGMKQQTYVAEPFTLAERGRDGSQNLEYRNDGTANAILTPNGGRGGMGVGAIAHEWAVRRLTPIECERLQGFPDHYTDIPPAGKNKTPDGHRYKALGNSMAVNVMRWIGQRIETIEQLK